MDIKLFLYALECMFLLSCKNDTPEVIKKSNKFNEAKESFEKAKKRFNECKNNYEKSTNHKIVIDIRYGSGISGAAEEVSDYLRELCYDTYYGNWDNNTEYYTRIIQYNQDKDMASQIIKDLDKKIKIKNELNLNQGIDLTLVIGKNYRNLNFYQKIKK